MHGPAMACPANSRAWWSVRDWRFKFSNPNTLKCSALVSSRAFPRENKVELVVRFLTAVPHGFLEIHCERSRVTSSNCSEGVVLFKIPNATSKKSRPRCVVMSAQGLPTPVHGWLCIPRLYFLRISSCFLRHSSAFSLCTLSKRMHGVDKAFLMALGPMSAFGTTCVEKKPRARACTAASWERDPAI